jgi:hypothetical protein
MTNWRTLHDEPIEDLLKFVSSVGEDIAVHIGTDSLQVGKYTQYVTVVALLKPHRGGRAIYKRLVVPRVKSLRERLLKEVWLSVEVALGIEQSVQGVLTVHVDANPDLKFKSSKYIQSLVGMVVSNGFRALVKPDAWCSSHIADHVVRTLGKMPRKEVA